jgi:hypothetical protein
VFDGYRQKGSCARKSSHCRPSSRIAARLACSRLQPSAADRHAEFEMPASGELLRKPRRRGCVVDQAEALLQSLHPLE